MPTYTTNLNLKKPNGDEFYNIADFNRNADLIDAAVSNVYTKTETLEVDVESVMLYVGYDKEVAGLCADFENNTFTRIAGSVGKSAGTDFDSWNLFGGRRRCNVADDGTINAWYGDSDFAEDGSNGQVMVYQPKFYYRVEPLKLEAQSTGIGYHLKKANYYVSDTQKAGFKLHPAFIDKNGNEIDYIMFSAYEGCLYDTSAGAYITNDSQVMNTSEDKLSSIANVKPCSGITQDLTRPNIEALAQNRGTDWHGETIQFASINQLLCAIEYASFNFQTAIGQGVVSYESGTGNEASNTGATSTLGNSSGQATETTHVSSDNVTTIDTTAGKLSVSYRGVENIWGNIWKFEYGVNIWGDGTMNGGQPYICSDYNFAESKNSDNYVGAGFTIANANGYIKYFGYSEDFDYLFIASEVGGTSSLPVGDYLYVTSNLNAYRIAPLGGYWAYGSVAGGFNWEFNGGVGGRARRIGCRLAYTPTR